MSRGDGLARLRQALEDYGCTVRGTSAQCPGPDHKNGDRTRSLSIGQGNDDCAILNCHLGCHTDTILELLGMSAADLRDEPREHGGGTGYQVAAEYRYADERGQLLFVKERRVPKDFRLKRPDGRGGWAWGLGDTRRVLYNLPAVLAAVAAGQPVYVAEGEKDADAIGRAGAVATCNFEGAAKDGQRPKWRPEYGDILKGAIAIVVADKDPAGYAHAAAIKADLDGKAGSVTVVEPAAGKDAADHLAAGYGLGDFRSARPETDTSGKPVSENTDPPTSENDTSDGSDSDVEYELRDGAWLDGQQFDPLKYTVPGLMPAGLGIIAAPPKAGKSLLVLDWLLAVALGGAALGRLRTGPARDVLYLALEDGDRRLQSRCRHLLAESEPIPERFRYILAVPPGQVLAVITDALSRHPDTALIVLDTLGRIMPLPYQGETTYQRDYRVAVALKRIADDHPGLTIIVIHHTRKAFSDDFIDSISGTHGLAGAADTIITLSRGRGKGDGVLHVTGRDVIEADYAVTFKDGVWALDGGTLAEARANAARRAEAGKLGERSTEIIDYVRGRPAGAKAGEVTGKFGKDAAQSLKRLTDAGRLRKPKRGLYVVSEPSEPSESQVRDGAETDTGLLEMSEPSEPGDEE